MQAGARGEGRWHPAPGEFLWLFHEYAYTETSYTHLAKQLNTRGIPGPGSGLKEHGERTAWSERFAPFFGRWGTHAELAGQDEYQLHAD